jgi:hypothetical protein
MAKHAPEKNTAEDIKKEGDELYLKKTEEEARLLELYNQKKLTNKDTIRKARAIAQKYEKKKFYF